MAAKRRMEGCWGWRNNNADLSVIAYGGDKFVAGGFGGKMAYSPDVVTWTAGRKFGSVFFESVAYGSGKFVAVELSSGIAFPTRRNKRPASAAPPASVPPALAGRRQHR
jgi:hypothetical protein